MKLGIIVALLIVLICSASAQDTVHVKAGWNVIGSVKAGAVPDVLFTLPDSLIISSFWGYTPGVGYESTDTLINGTGYWVKAKSDGLIVFNNAPPVDSCKSKAFIYEGKLYHTILIGNQCWMAENLDVGVMVLSAVNQSNNDTTEKYCYLDNPFNCALYGGLYQWTEAMQYLMIQGAQGICPSGWHIPTLAECQTLSSAVGGDGNALKAVRHEVDGAATNISGFSGLLTADTWIGTTFYPGGFAKFWNSKAYLGGYAGHLFLTRDDSGVYLYATSRALGLSVRCIED